MDTMSLAIVIALGVFLSIVFTRWLFQIDTQVKNQKLMIELLSTIAKKQGASQDEIESLIKTVFPDKK